MKVLSKRQISLVNRLAQENGWLATTQAAKILDISVSTLRRDVEAINLYFADKGNYILSKPGLGLKLDANGIVSLPAASGDEHVVNILKSKRLVGITTDLLTHSPTPLSISFLSEKYFISRSSIVEDLNKIDKWLGNFSLQMIKNHTGTHIEGNDYDIRMALKEIITHSVLCNYQMTDSRIDRFSRVQLIKEFGKENVANCINLITFIEDELACAISEPYYTNLFSHLLVTIRRMEQRKHHSNDDCVPAYDTKEWQIAVKAISWLEKKYTLSFPAIEISYIYQYLVSSGKHQVHTSPLDLGVADKEALSYAINLTSALSQSLKCDLISDKALLNALVMHIKPMLNRLSFRIIIHNPLLDEIKKELSEVFIAVRNATMRINNYSKHDPPSEDEVAYLTVYIQAAIEKVKENKKIILVCSSGVGTSQLLYSRITKAFPDWEIIDIVPGSRLKKTLAEKKCDLIISTIRIEEMMIPVAYVSALFSAKDIIRVTETLFAERNFQEK
ncbi:transcriptional antiterminator [Serratia fonticola]|jgi:activator of the mannose operon (transcriptional antiterminator)|uniref:Transcriptional antiterminator n=1 Tax=Serratia fonticola TaxID=47917 RepID=A0A542D723_SERFO|nr:PRD domain-containing protein [Serratia fonticola]TQI79086.1 transcriptional antiterminator [Serratia fonticola]TQI98892.1 transcriptional antiterminator [Serratia fonticola]TVZ68417.1 transcriptional antiterminator [Serratia fonticola]